MVQKRTIKYEIVLKLKRAWYIVNYHNVDWSDNDFLSPLNLTISPNLLYEHIRCLSKHGTIVSFSDGLKLYESNNINYPIISFSFDDGYKGVYNYANKILNEFNISGLTSICSKFYKQNELFWRLKLAYIHSNNGDRFIRSRLKKIGFSLNNNRISKFTIDNFSDDVIKMIDEVFDKYNIDERKKSSNLFMDKFMLMDLVDEGWNIGNHSTNHYPYSEESCIDFLATDFILNNNKIFDDLKYDCNFLTIPFDRQNMRSKKLKNIIDKNFKEFKIVLVGNKFNKNNKDNFLYRYASKHEDPKDLLKLLCT